MSHKDPFPHPALREGVIPRLLSCVCRAMAIARLIHLRISILVSGAPPGHVPDDCFPRGAPRKARPGSLRVSFADNVTMLGVMPPSVCSPVLEEPTPLVSSVVMDDVIIPEGGRMSLLMLSRTLSHLLRVSCRFHGRSLVTMSPWNSPVLRSAMVVRRTFLSAIRTWSRCFRRLHRIRIRCLSGRRTLASWCLPWWILVRIRCRPSFDLCLSCRPSTTSSRRTGCGRRLLFRRRALAIVARPQYLGGGWLGRARSWRSDLLSRSTHNVIRYHPRFGVCCDAGAPLTPVWPGSLLTSDRSTIAEVC